MDISSVAANKSNVQIEWRWTTKLDVAWMIDDVELLNGNPLLDQVIWHEDNFLVGPNNWSVLPSNQFDSCHWVSVDSAMVHLPVGDKAFALACWPGVEDGAMLINASYCSRYGNSSPFTRSDLLSPKIDMSGIPTGTRLYLRFNQLVALANPAQTGMPKTSIAISIDDGINFIDTIDANPLSRFFQTACGEANFQLPLSVAGKPKVRLKFIFSSDTHFWLVDDVRIAHSYDNDIEINPLFYNVAPDFGVPASQVRPVSFYAQVRNAGNIANNSIIAHVAVFNSVNEKTFEDEVVLLPVQPSDSWTNVNFPNKWTPAGYAEDYIVHYWVTSSQDDENMLNDRVYWRFKVTEDVFSKSEFCPTTIGYFLPVENHTYEIGNCYYMPKGSKLKAEAVSFAFRNAALLANKNAELNINLYRWKNDDNNGDVNNDSTANLNEFENVAQNNYKVMGNESNEVVTVPISFQPEVETILEDDTYYFVTVGYLNPVFQNGQPVVFPIAASEEINYTAAFYNSYADGKPAFTSMLREGEETEFRANAWALRRIPFMNLHVSPYVNSVEGQDRENIDFTVSPNPSNEIVWLTAEFEGNQEPITVEIFDLCGQKVLENRFETGNVSQQPIFVGKLSNGSYMIRVISDGKMSSKKLLIFR
ncbi:MAG: T9SS type A sorting domain-containing protein [Saprospiraceae bacterium]|nr:T9SS type A sorting domain-containing protein [Saprospiraceae bacterium]